MADDRGGGSTTALPEDSEVVGLARRFEKISHDRFVHREFYEYQRILTRAAK